MADATTPSRDADDRACIHSRLVDAPRARVFKAFADPRHLARWWGPKGFTITFTAQGDQTRVGWRQEFDTAAHRDQVADIVLAANEQNLDRLAAEVRNVS